MGNDSAATGNDAQGLAAMMGSRERGTSSVSDEGRICSTERSRVQTDSISAAAAATVERAGVQVTQGPKNEEAGCCDAIAAEAITERLHSTGTETQIRMGYC